MSSRAVRRRLARVHRRSTSVRGIILLFHRVADLALDPWELAVRPERFHEQLEVLRRCCAPAHLDDLATAAQVRAADGRLPVAITFDDGYLDNLTTALPALERAEWPATFFIAGHGEAEDFWWDVLARVVIEAPARSPLVLPLPAGRELQLRLDEPPPAAPQAAAWRAADAPSHSRFATYLRCWQTLRDLRPADRDRAMEPVRRTAAALLGDTPDRRLSDREVADLQRSPAVRLGAHTLSHPRLSVLRADERRQEIAGSRRRLQRLAERPISAFSYPYGARDDYGAAAVQAVREAGFELACRNAPGVVDGAARRFELPRLFMRDEPGDAFERRLLKLIRTGA